MKKKKKKAALVLPDLPKRSDRCGRCYWALYDGATCMNSACPCHGRVPDTRIALTNAEAHAIITATQRGSATFAPGDMVCKVVGGSWHGRVVGRYSTDFTHEGYAVESFYERGSVQIYPAKALGFWQPSKHAKCGCPKMVNVEKYGMPPTWRTCERLAGHTGRHMTVFCGKRRYWL